MLDSDAMSAILIDWLDRYPIVSIEDPLAEHDAAGFTRFTKAVGHRVQIVGDDFLVTDAARLRRAAAMPACNAILVKPNQVGTGAASSLSCTRVTAGMPNSWPTPTS